MEDIDPSRIRYGPVMNGSNQPTEEMACYRGAWKRVGQYLDRDKVETS
jgi:hypothetical protein